MYLGGTIYPESRNLHSCLSSSRRGTSERNIYADLVHRYRVLSSKPDLTCDSDGLETSTFLGERARRIWKRSNVFSVGREREFSTEMEGWKCTAQSVGLKIRRKQEFVVSVRHRSGRAAHSVALTILLASPSAVGAAFPSPPRYQSLQPSLPSVGI